MTPGAKLKFFFVYWIPLILYCGIIFFQSGYPSPIKAAPFPNFDKLLHAAAYAVMGILWARAYNTLGVRKRPLRMALLAILSATLYGVSDELHQSFIPMRNADAIDVVADLTGATIGVYLYMRFVLKAGNQKT